MESVDAAKNATRYAADFDPSDNTTAGSTASIPLGPATPCTNPMVSDHLAREDTDAAAAAATSAPPSDVVMAGSSPSPSPSPPTTTTTPFTSSVSAAAALVVVVVVVVVFCS